MVYAVASDIHSNLEALTEFFKNISEYSIDKIIFLGDLVGYNSNPNECVELISKMSNIQIIRGNHDRVVISKEYDNFSKDAKSAVKWTEANIDSYGFNYLRNLEGGPKIINDSFVICHGSILNEDDYILSGFDAKRNFDWLINNEIKLGFFGHTHCPVSFYFDKTMNKITTITEKDFFLNKDDYYLINPGSIGQPRDKDNRLSFLIYDSDNKRINFIRRPYPLQITKEKDNLAGLPKFLADRLESGI